MNTFKWLVNKFRKATNWEIRPSNPDPRMGEPPYVKRRVRESSAQLSVSERVQKGKAELEEVHTIVRLQVRSEVTGVIDGDITIPFAIELTRTWNEIFKKVDIDFDPEHHLLRAYGRIITDFSVPIQGLYSLYKRQRHTYHATILPRDGSLKKKPVGRRRKSIQNRNKAIPPKSDQQQNKTVSKTSRPTRRTVQRKGTANGNGDRRQVNNVNTTASSSSSSSRNNGDGGVTVTNNQPLVPDSAVSMNDVESPPEGNNEAMEARIPFRFQSTSAFSMGPPPPPPRHFAPPQVPTLTNSGEMPQLAFRDESTMAGDIVLPNEPELKNAILQYFRGHCSNRDMLSMRNELLGLKRARKFQALNRLIPFTAGILQNAFIDDLN